MLRKLTKRITNNFGLKVLAVVFAIVIWLVVVNIEDPEKTKGFTIPVTIENSDYLTDMGKTYDILNNSVGNVQVNLTLPSLIRTFAAQFATTYDFNRRPHRRVQRHDAFQRHLLHDRRQGPDRPDGQKRSGQIDPAEDHRRSAFGHAGARDRGRRRESGVSAPAPSGGGRAHAR